jgi:hypothetical protein
VTPARRRSHAVLLMVVAGIVILAGGGTVLLLNGKPSAAPRASVAAARATPAAVEGAERIRVPVSDQVPPRLPASGVPRGWQLKEFAGQAAVELVRTDGRLAVRLRSDRASFALHRDVVVDLKEFPFLTWSWKVSRLPAAGDVRDHARDDEAAQIYVVFPRWPSPRTTSEVIGYVWDSRAPVGTRLRHPRAPNVHIIVVESGPGRLDGWLRYERNVAADYAAIFGHPPPRVGKVALMTDSNDTRSEAEALIGDIFFSRTSAGRAEIPSIVLR